ncbi:MAG: hypothetical protein AVDCRST_MAG87-3483, partial [uncultured Thermomicrobiales bacterium]
RTIQLRNEDLLAAAGQVPRGPQEDAGSSQGDCTV